MDKFQLAKDFSDVIYSLITGLKTTTKFPNLQFHFNASKMKKAAARLKIQSIIIWQPYFSKS